MRQDDEGSSGTAEQTVDQTSDEELLKRVEALQRELDDLRRLRVVEQAVLRDARICFWRWEQEGDILKYESTDFEEILGVPKDASIDSYDSHAAFIHPEDGERVQRTYRAADAAKEGYSLSYRTALPDGSIRYFTEIGHTTVDGEGRFDGHVGLVQDTTALAEAQLALGKSETSYREILDAIPTPISVKDREGRYSFVNRNMRELHGFPDAEVTGKSAVDFFDKSAAEVISSKDRTVIESGANLPLYEETLSVDGVVRSFVTTKVPLKDSQGRVEGIASIAVELSKLKEVESALRENEKRFRDFAAAASDWYWETDQDLKLSYLSERQEEMTGRSNDQLIGKALTVLIQGNDDDDEKLARALQSVLEEHRPFRDFRITMPLGREDAVAPQLSLSGVPFRSLEGRFMGFRGVGRDATWEGELEALRTEAKERGQRSQRMELIGQLTGGIAHDFNNLLAIIQGNTELLEERLDEQKPLLSAIQRAAVRGGELTQRLLSFSRRQPLHPQKIVVADLIDQVMELLQRSVGEALDMEISCEDRTCAAFADETQLQTALLNLALNARDAMPTGGRLRFVVERQDIVSRSSLTGEGLAPGRYIAIAVEDQGHGIAEEDLPKVIEPFFTTKNVGEGSGLGLSMVYGFAKQSDGHLTLSSVKGEGTKATLLLPLHDSDAEESNDQAAKARNANYQKQSILVVEDQPDVLELTVTLLRNLGYEVLAAEDGWSAMEILKRGAGVDLIFTDVVLPKQFSGPELVREARKFYNRVPVVYMSGYIDHPSVDSLIMEEDSLILRKPFRRRELAAIVEKALASGLVA